MSGFNQKGPLGQGSMSGRKMGKCTNFGTNVSNKLQLPVQVLLNLYLRITQEKVLEQEKAWGKVEVWDWDDNIVSEMVNN